MKEPYFWHDYVQAGQNSGDVCPPKAIAYSYATVKKLYLSDSGHYSKVLQAAKDAAKIGSGSYKEFDLKSVQDGTNSNSNSNSNINPITAKKCSCNGTEDSRHIVTSFEITSSATAPTLSVIIRMQNNSSSQETKSLKILNWTEGKPYSTDFAYLPYLMANNKCPDYLIVQKSNTGHHAFVTDSASKSQMITDIKKEYSTTKFAQAIACTEQAMEPVPSNSNSNSNSSDPYRPDPERPGVNSNIGPLEPDFDTVKCGDDPYYDYITGIPQILPKVTRMIYNFIQLLVPVILIVLGTLDLVKAIMGQKDDEIVKGRQTFIKRVITAVLVFFTFAMIKLVVSFASGADSRVFNCVECFVKNNYGQEDRTTWRVREDTNNG